MNLSLPQIFALGAGTLLIYSAIKGTSPVDVLKNVLKGQDPLTGTVRDVPDVAADPSIPTQTSPNSGGFFIPGVNPGGAVGLQGEGGTRGRSTATITNKVIVGNTTLKTGN